MEIEKKTVQDLYKMPEQQLIKLFNQQPIDIWINSFGGCRSNYIRDLLKNKYSTYNAAYEYKGCHYIKPLKVNVGSALFCYVENVGIALTSQLNREMYHNYDKLNNKLKDRFSINNWLDKINQQIDWWTSPSYFPIVILNTDNLLSNKQLFEEVYGVEIKDYENRKTRNYHKKLLPHLKQIQQINKKLKQLPDLGGINI